MKTKHLVIITLLIVLALTSCGGHKSGSTTQSGSSGGSSKDQNTPKISLPTAGKITTSVSVVPNLIQITTSQKTDYLNAQFAKYGYSVAYRTGNYVTLNVPDGDLNMATYQLRKEPAVLAVDVIHKYTIDNRPTSYHVYKSASFYPADAFYGDRFREPNSDPTKFTDPAQDTYNIGQKLLMDVMNPEQAWDVVLRMNGVGTTPVVLAIIDAGIYKDASGNHHPDFQVSPVGTNPDRFSPLHARVFAGGNTDTTDWGYDTYLDSSNNQVPYRDTGNAMFGIAASSVGISRTTSPVSYYRVNPPVNNTDLWPASIAGVNPTATVLVIKTGTGSGTVWSFTDQEITNSINYAVTNGANVILLGMFSNVGATPVNSALQTAITAARNAGILVIAPAGEGDLSQPTGTPPVFNNGVDVSNISPAKATGVFSVAASGVNQSNFGETGVYNQIGNPYQETVDQLAGYSDLGNGVSIAAPGIGIGYSANYYNIDFGTEVSTAYVAGAATICYQALVNANGGTPPAAVDQTIANILQQTSDFRPSGLNNTGVLNIGLAATIANNGGWDRITPALDISGISTPNMYNDAGIIKILPTVGDPFSVTVNATGGTPPYNIIVAWGDGTRTPASGSQPFVSGDIINKPNPYTQPGNLQFAVIVGDSSTPPQQSVFTFPLLVTNPLGVGPITLKSANGDPVTAPAAGQTYTFLANLTNVLVAPGNTVSYSWDFGDTGTSTLENPTHAWIGSGAKIVTLTVTETLRIPVTHQDTFTVSP